MARKDQRMRMKSVTAIRKLDQRIDLQNTTRLKKIIKDVGWPRISIFGMDVVHSAWILVQHADHDLNFQIKCLRAMQKLPKDEVLLADRAYLQDRILWHQGKPTLFGTQCVLTASGKVVPHRIRNPDQVDARRKVVGLGPLSRQINHLQKIYFESQRITRKRDSMLKRKETKRRVYQNE